MSKLKYAVLILLISSAALLHADGIAKHLDSDGDCYFHVRRKASAQSLHPADQSRFAAYTARPCDTSRPYPNAEYEVSALPDRQSKTCPRPPGRQWQCSSAYLFFLPYGCSHSRYPIYYTLSRIVCSSFRLDLGIVLHFHSNFHIFRHITATFVLKPSLFSPLYAI